MSYHVTKNQQSKNIIEIVGLLIIVFLIRTYGFGLYQVPTGMITTRRKWRWNTRGS